MEWVGRRGEFAIENFREKTSLFTMECLHLSCFDRYVCKTEESPFIYFQFNVSFLKQFLTFLIFTGIFYLIMVPISVLIPFEALKRTLIIGLEFTGILILGLRKLIQFKM